MTPRELTGRRECEVLLLINAHKCEHLEGVQRMMLFVRQDVTGVFKQVGCLDNLTPSTKTPRQS